MLKNALFFFWKNLEKLPQRWPPAAGGSAPKAPSCYSHSTYVSLLSAVAHADFFKGLQIFSKVWSQIVRICSTFI